MSEIPPVVFSYREGELFAFRDLVGRRINREIGSAWLWTALAAATLSVGLVVLAAAKAGLLLDEDVPITLPSAYIAFAAGALVLIFLLRIQQRRFAHRLYQATGRAGEEWELTFEAAGIVCKGSLYETRVSWQAVNAVEQIESVVVIWFARVQNLCIPARVFADDAARAAFIAAIQVRIDGANAGRA